MTKLIRTLAITSAFGTSLVSACAWHEPSRVEEDFGKSVRSMVAEQIYDKQVASSPAALGPDVLDGDAAVTGIDGYREATRQTREPARTSVPITGIADIE